MVYTATVSGIEVGMGVLDFVVMEISPVGDFFIPPRSYDLLNAASSQARFLAFGAVDSSVRVPNSTIPEFSCHHPFCIQFGSHFILRFCEYWKRE
jgi:hypothetical protein